MVMQEARGTLLPGRLSFTLSMCRTSRHKNDRGIGSRRTFNQHAHRFVPWVVRSDSVGPLRAESLWIPRDKVLPFRVLVGEVADAVAVVGLNDDDAAAVRFVLLLADDD